MGTFHDGEIAGFYYENPANDLGDGENFVLERVSDDGVCRSDGESDDGRGHIDDDHDNHGSLYYLHGDEGDYGNDDQSDGDCKSRDSVYHLCIRRGNDEDHGHNDDDHENNGRTMSSNGEGNSHDGDGEEIDIDDCVAVWQVQL